MLDKPPIETYPFLHSSYHGAVTVVRTPRSTLARPISETLGDLGRASTLRIGRESPLELDQRFRIFRTPAYVSLRPFAVMASALLWKDEGPSLGP
jgi:hypothetical protein